MLQFVQSVWLTTYLILLGSTTNVWTSILLWVVRISTFSLLFRTYIGPWLLSSISARIRIRSISLRSIRGLYFRTGSQTWRVERISYTLFAADGSKRRAISFNGMSLDIEVQNKDDAPPQDPVPHLTRRHRRNLTLANLNPSPFARQLLDMSWKMRVIIDPYLRPIIRSAVVAGLRLAIQWLPGLTQSLSFDFHSTTVKFSDIPGTTFAIEEMRLNTALQFTQVDRELDDQEQLSNVQALQGPYSVGAWRRRLREGFRRSLDRAWGKARGTADATFTMRGIVGMTLLDSVAPERKSVPFFLSPGAIELGASVNFNPKAGTIDPRSLETALSIGDCSIKVDLVAALLKKLRPKPSTVASPSVGFFDQASARSPYPDSPPAMSSRPKGSASLSPRLSLASSLFSPAQSSAVYSEQEIESHPASPKINTSPFLRVFSGSMRPRARHYIQPRAKLTEAKNKSLLLPLRNVVVTISTITLSTSTDCDSGSYRATVRDVSAGLRLSDPALDHLHKQWLGTTLRTECFDPPSYTGRFSAKKVTLSRQTKQEEMRFLQLRTLDLDVLVSQWPSPWLAASPFMQGDPNSSLLVARFSVEGVHFTERIQELTRLMETLLSFKKQSTVSSRAQTIYPIPRVAFEFHCGPICARILCEPRPSLQPLAVDIRSQGISISASSSYNCFSSSVNGLPSDSLDNISSHLHVAAKTILVRVRSTLPHTRQDHKSYALDQTFLDDPAMISLETLELSGSISGPADVDSRADGVAAVDFSALSMHIAVTSDILCVELWHPHVLEATRQLLRYVQASSKKIPVSSVETEQKSFDLTGSMNVARFVIFITAPDINPQDSSDLSRGVALRTGASMEYASPSSAARLSSEKLRRTNSRSQLRLPEESKTKTFSDVEGISLDNGTRISLRLFNLGFRAALATQYEPDDPTIAGRDDMLHGRGEFLHADDLRVDVLLLKEVPALKSVCHISVNIPYITGVFQVGYVYSILLALQTVANLFAIQSNSSSNRTQNNITISFTISITAFQITWNLLKEELVTRFDRFTARLLPDLQIVAGFESLVAWVLLPLHISQWKVSLRRKWAELLRLTMWNAKSCLKAASSISLAGDGAHIQIPHGFVLADLIFDASVAFKAVRHLYGITTLGIYSDMPIPTPEGPKLVPNMSLRIQSLCLEAQDDPFETKLGLIWREGFDAARQRSERENAFQVKVAAILAAESQLETPLTQKGAGYDYHFSAKHSVSIEEARRRLDDVHVLDWGIRLEKAREVWSKQENFVRHKLHGRVPLDSCGQFPDIGEVNPIKQAPPLLRAMFHDLHLVLSRPSFPLDKLHTFLNERGTGLPANAEFSLLVPMHLCFSLSSTQFTLRDYPLPLLAIPANANAGATWKFKADLVIAEEMGTDASVDWIDYPIIKSDGNGLDWTLSVPKTIMPVKSYASPVIEVTSDDATVLSWSVSYGPAIQDAMRIIETLTRAPQDPSPGLGFWDKIRLVFHWSVKVSFKGDARFYLKGSRDPYSVDDTGAGFVLCWQGSPELLIGHKNSQRELIQVTSNVLYIAIPNLEHVIASTNLVSPSRTEKSNPFRKICAKFGSGIRFGIGFVLERACGEECLKCTGTPLRRSCRYFEFRPHYTVKLEKKPTIPVRNAPDDSYTGFRSDFIHLSVSLASSLSPTAINTSRSRSSLHLTPKAFAHFFSWWSLFDSTLTLPIRQGNYFPSHPLSPKFGRHLATLKYQLKVRNVFVMHGYIDDSREAWADGVTPWVGLKGIIDEFQADMHQRDEEAVVAGPIPHTTKIIRRKPFYAAEVVLKGLDLRTMLAVFSEPLKHVVPITAPPESSNYRKREELPVTPSSSLWYDKADFVETDWSCHAAPRLHLLPLTTCPHFTYFKRNSASTGKGLQNSKFGQEHSHACLLGQEPSVPHIQITLTLARISELKKQKSRLKDHSLHENLDKMIALLDNYVTSLRESETAPDSIKANDRKRYHMPPDIVSPDEWAEFDNVYQIHSPNIFMDSATRDILLQYYYCSRARKGFEYHMATRAVKFIRDQADTTLPTDEDVEVNRGRGHVNNTAQIAASALRKILKVDNGKTSADVSRNKDSELLDPLHGWTDGVSLRKSHCFLLLKPQIVLRGEGSMDACIVAAAQAKLQSFGIMDNANLDDPISGKVMTRNYTSLSGIQTFSVTKAFGSRDGRVPLEVLIDFRCESSDFERLVPQTDATFHYDKFNRLRLRNNITSVVSRASTDRSGNNHLHDQTDLIRVHIPRFTVSASDEHFQVISNVVNKLLLFSDAAHKTRLDKLETMLFTYDFTDLKSAAKVVSDLQARLRDAMESERLTMKAPERLEDADNKLGLMKLKAHIFLLAEELNLLFDAIKLAQDRGDDKTDQKSALLLHASSSEISWLMLEERRDLLAKLVVKDSNFYWLSRQDSSTVNNLTIGDLTAFDGSRHAIWPEILAKHYESAHHPLSKRGLFLLSNWTILPPVGGITIYEAFELTLHPLRLQIDSKVGKRIMEYVWPARRERNKTIEREEAAVHIVKSPASRSSLDSPRTLQTFREASTEANALLAPPLRKLGASRSFTDLRVTTASEPLLSTPVLHKMPSSQSIRSVMNLRENENSVNGGKGAIKAGDAAVMKTRSSQKTFVLVKISSLDLLLSIVTEGSFECHNARIRTRELEYRNQTWNFEELVNQFIPSNMSWRGWVKMAFHQPLIPVLPVARELISKTKWKSSKGGTQSPDRASQLLHLLPSINSDSDSSLAPASRPNTSSRKPPSLLRGTAQEEESSEDSGSRRRRVLSLLAKGKRREG